MTEKEIENKLIKGIKFGPFRRQHYREVVDEGFRNLVLTYVKEGIIPKISISIDKIKGEVYAPHDNDAKGELKAYRNKFAFYGKFYEGRVFDEVRFTFFYKPATNTIKLLDEPFVYTVEQHRNSINTSRNMDEVISKFYSGNEEILCPKCCQKLNLSIWDINGKKYIKYLSCPTGCLFANFNLTDAITRKPYSLLNNKFVTKFLLLLDRLYSFCKSKFWSA
jgi:hypothetical protein